MIAGCATGGRETAAESDSAGTTSALATGTEGTTTGETTTESPTTGISSSGELPPDSTSAGTSGTSDTMELGSTADGVSSSTTDVGSTGETPPPGQATLQLQITPIKGFIVSWEPASGAAYYRLLERRRPGDPYTQVGGDTVELSASVYVPLHLRAEASYVVSACNDGGCTDSEPVDVIGSLAEAVGYFKPSNGKADFYFGESVALSADGNILAVGAPKEDGAATGINGDSGNLSAPDAGAVYVFARVDGLWSQQAYIKPSNTGPGDRFGYSVSLSADGATLAVGAPHEDGGSTGVGGLQNDASADSGAVYVFRRTDDKWSQQAYVKASNTRPGSHFGLAVNLSGDGQTLAVGAENESSGAVGIGGDQGNTGAPSAGAVYVFAATNNTWSQQAYVKASNTDAGDYFGHSVALSHDGDTLAASAVFESSALSGINVNQADDSAPQAGAVYVFSRTNHQWSQQAYIKASNTGAGDLFGSEIDLSADGAVLAVGALAEDSAAVGVGGSQGDNGASDAGAVYIFSQENAVWSQTAYVKASNTGAGDLFGYSLTLSGDGKVLATSAALEDGASVGIGGDEASDDANNAGGVYVFELFDDAWVQRAYVKAPNPGPEQRFGDSVALSLDGSTLVSGTNLEPSSATGIGGDQLDKSAPAAGAVYIY